MSRKHSFVSPLQSPTSKTSITQQKSLCPTHEDVRDVHICIVLTVSRLEHREEAELKKLRRQTLATPAHQLRMAEPVAAESLVATEVAHATPVSGVAEGPAAPSTESTQDSSSLASSMAAPVNAKSTGAAGGSKP